MKKDNHGHDFHSQRTVVFEIDPHWHRPRVASTTGNAFCLLPQTMVVSTSNVLPLQKMQRRFQWIGSVNHGLWHGGGSCASKWNYCHSHHSPGGRGERNSRNFLSRWTCFVSLTPPTSNRCQNKECTFEASPWTNWLIFWSKCKPLMTSWWISPLPWPIASSSNTMLDSITYLKTI